MKNETKTHTKKQKRKTLKTLEQLVDEMKQKEEFGYRKKNEKAGNRQEK